MKIAYKHLLECIKEKPSIENISSRLFQLGHENTIVDGILDIEFTPNRGDCLSLKGLLRDLSVFYEVDFKKEIFESEIKKFEFKFKNSIKDICPSISFLKIDIKENINEYTKEIESYFKELDIKKVNFFTDISNYISYETGQPTHCYDAKKLCNGVELHQLNEQSEFQSLLGNNLTLNKEDIVFSSNNKIINLAGIVGSKSTACTNNTLSVIVECAFFKPDSIIGKTVQYDIVSDAAYKFERGVDPLIHELVLRRFIKIVEQHADIKNLEIFQQSCMDYKKNLIDVSVTKISKIIGYDIPKVDYETILKKLGFVVKKNLVTVPSFRQDVETENDIAEEIARVIGYDNLPRNKLYIQASKKQKIDHVKIIKNFLIDNGFHEVINNPFVAEGDKYSIKVDNPIDIKKHNLRTNIKSSLISNLKYNENRQKDSVKIFEVSDLYYKKDGLNKKTAIGILASGRLGKNYKYFFKKIDEKYLVNLLLKLLPNNEFKIDLVSRESINSKKKDKIFYVEINLCDLDIKSIKYDVKNIAPIKYVQYKPVSEFPTSFRDLSFSITDASVVKTLEQKLINYESDIVKDIFIFDYFVNKNTNEIKLGCRFIFQSHKETLKDEQVDKVINDIICVSLKINSVRIPGINDTNKS